MRKTRERMEDLRKELQEVSDDTQEHIALCAWVDAQNSRSRLWNSDYHFIIKLYHGKWILFSSPRFPNLRISKAFSDTPNKAPSSLSILLHKDLSL